MSNIWKVYGLAAVSREFGIQVGKLSEAVEELETSEPDAERRLQAAVEVIDGVMRKFRCPLGHLDVQAFRDSLFATEFWSLLASIQAKGAFEPVPADPLIFDEYCRVIGLALTDPWRGDGALASKGFRHQLKDDARATLKNHGFLLPDELADRIATGLTKNVVDGQPRTVLDVMDKTAEFWEDATFYNLTDRARYKVLIHTPQGWIIS